MHRLGLLVLICLGGCAVLFPPPPSGTYEIAGVYAGEVEHGKSIIVGTVRCLHAEGLAPVGVQVSGIVSPLSEHHQLYTCCHHGDGEAWASFLAVADSSGAFRAEVEPGRYTVRAGRIEDRYGPIRMGALFTPGRLCRDGSIEDPLCGCQIVSQEIVVDTSSTVRVNFDLDARE